MNPVFFLSQHIALEYPADTLVKVGVNMIYVKGNSTYRFGGLIIHEDDSMAIFIALPKRIQIGDDDDNWAEIIDYKRCDHLSRCHELRQYGAVFERDHFVFNGKKYYAVEDMYKFDLNEYEHKVA